MPSIECPFRLDVRQTAAGEVATCALVQQMIGAADATVCEVDQSACEVCVAALPGRVAELNPVLPSLVYKACERLHERELRTGRTHSLFSWAGSVLTTEPINDFRSSACGCDVVIFCRDSSNETRAAVRSAIEQDDCISFLHLVHPGHAAAVVEEYRAYCNVRTWDLPECRDVWQAVHQLLPRLRTPFLAIQDPATVAHPRRLAWGLSQLERHGAEFYASPVEVNGRLLPSIKPDGLAFERRVRPETLIMRRATLIDMGGVADRPDADVELLYRAAREDRSFRVDDVVTLSASGVPDLPAPGPVPDYPFARVLRTHALGFEMTAPACDVVLPFRGQFGFVQSAMESLVEQHNADVVIHLIDDASEEDASTMLTDWAGRRNVRTYRNRKNIGPFASFNNVSAFFETGYAAVQDGDDISEPGRVFWSCNSLRLSGAELFGGTMLLFGDEAIQRETASTTEPGAFPGDVRRFRHSRIPGTRDTACFLQNPTLVVRTDTFRSLGGYSDFGEQLRNRTGIDTEFVLRAACAGCSFSISHEPVVRYRCHGESATQHPSTGMGSRPNLEAAAERRRRLEIYRRSAFHPASFGALRLHAGVTERL